MATVETYVEAPPERCFEVLSDPRSFAYWVVGSKQVRTADPDWPAPGSRFHHTTALGIKDHTVVEEIDPHRRLRLRARMRPLGTAFVTIHMQPQNGGSRLRIEEGPADLVSRLVFNPVFDRLLRSRNEISIERLKDLAEGRVQIPPGDYPVEAPSTRDRGRGPSGSPRSPGSEGG
jgi:uncharacterized protein YndB with AHSA1/START domain